MNKAHSSQLPATHTLSEAVMLPNPLSWVPANVPGPAPPPWLDYTRLKITHGLHSSAFPPASARPEQWMQSKEPLQRKFSPFTYVLIDLFIVCVCVLQNTREAQMTTSEVCSLLHHMGPGNQTPALRGGQCLYSLSHQADPRDSTF